MPATNSIEGLRLAAVRAEQLESFLPLIESYQRFNEVTSIDRGRNRGFFGRLIAPSHLGALLGAWRQELPIGYACLQWSFDSIRAEETTTLHDLWVEPGARRSGVGRALAEAAADMAHARGAQALVGLALANDPAALQLARSLGAQGQLDRTEYRLKL